MLQKNTVNPLLDTEALPRFSAIRPEHVEPAVHETIENNSASLNEILEKAASSSPDFENTILPLEELADRLYRVWSPVAHLHAVANTPRLRKTYNRCLPAIARYETELGQNDALYRVYQQVAGEIDPSRTDGAVNLLKFAIRDFERAGVNLADAEKTRFKAIVERLTQIQAQFEQNVLDSMAEWSCHVTDADRLAGLPSTVLERAAADAAEKSIEGWLFRLDQPTYTAIVNYADDVDLRAELHRAWVTRASDTAPANPAYDNTAIMEEILSLRHEATRLLGFNGYAEYSIAAKMATSVDEVRGFLQQLAERSYPAALKDKELLERFAGRSLDPWDIAYYSEKLRMERYSVSDEELRPYFPLDRVLQGLFSVIHGLYGLTVAPADSVDVWHSDVSYYRLVEEDGTEIGGVFIDLFARPEKRSGAWMDECVSRKRFNGELQKPVAHLVCNFSPPTRSRPSLLTHDEVVTLFHEFGHTLHHLLSRVDYPSVSGINGVPWDAVELPSQFFENFAWQPEVLTRISGHFETNEPLPEALIDKLQASRVFHSGLQMMRQLEFALFDIRLHAEYSPEAGARIPELLAEIRAQVSVFSSSEYNRFAHAFSHIFGGGYAAGYYSYKWAEVLAADAFSAFEENGLFDKDMAQRFRRCILEIGGTRDIGEAFIAFRGRPPDIDALVRQAGLLVEDRPPAVAQ